MARIRTIKPEFWTDEIIVQLPFQARLLFIGIWNFADDHGAIEESADRLRMQVFPGEPSLDVDELIDLLVTADLLERFQNEEGKRVVQVRNWQKHQKVDNPGKSRVLGDTYRKLAIPNEARRAVAIKYGCKPSGTKDVECYFCGSPGQVHWWPRHDGRPSNWVVFPGLELDHLEPEFTGGANAAENLVLSCRPCNRGRRDKAALPWIVSRAFASPIESSTSEGIKEGKGREKEKRGADAPQPFDPSTVKALDPEAWRLWVEHRKEIKKPIRPHSMPDAAEELAKLGDQQLAEVKRARAGGWQGLHPEKTNGARAPAPADPPRAREFPSMPRPS